MWRQQNFGAFQILLKISLQRLLQKIKFAFDSQRRRR